jgi:tetratricopeptide (TPR) repeat protein
MHSPNDGEKGAGIGMIGLSNLVRNMAKFKILIVDDEASVRRSIRQSLKELGFENFREAEDGEEALEKLKAETFDFMICDWDMPRLNGLLTLLNIRNQENLIDLPVLMTGAQAEERNLADILGPDEDGCLSKPFSTMALEEKMFEILFKKMPPSAIDPHMRAAGLAIADGNFTTAHAQLDSAEVLEPRNPLVGYFRRMVFEAEGRQDKAKEAADQARRLFKMVVLGPRRAKQYIVQGKALLDDGHVEQARQSFDKALELDPENPERKVAIGEAYLNKGLTDEAAQIFGDYLATNPEAVYVYNRLGLVYRRQKQFDKAIEYYQKAIEIDPDEEYVYYNLARAYLRAGDTDHAIQVLNKALELEPTFDEAAQLLSVISGGE